MMRALVSYPGVFQDAQQAARAFHERGELAAFVTGLVLNERSLALRVCTACLPERVARRLAREFRRRAVTEIPPEYIISYPWLDSLRTLLTRSVKGPIWADRVWDAMSKSFDKTVGRRHLHDVQLVYAFEYTARYTFECAKSQGIARVLGLPSLDSKHFEDIKSREESKFPELQTKYDAYFRRRFQARYERRRAEVALADLVITNSELTRQSHIAAGADPLKIVAVPLAAPAAIAAVELREHSVGTPLSVIWAGTFSVRKGAHYFLDAWRALAAGDKARADVYGAIGLPDRVLRPPPRGLALKGSVPQQDLFAAFERADVLAFPTLSDGFGSVVLEAFSRGLPVITTASAGASEFVEHGKNGLIVPPADAGALATALQWCLDHRDALFEMRAAALETARRWQWSDYRRLLIAKVTDALAAAPRAVDLAPANQAVGVDL